MFVGNSANKQEEKKMKFTKMQGIGNDYVYINGFEEKVSNKSEIAQFVSNRNFGIGADGAIFINPSDIADCEMEMYNADGSRSEMCGNGIRCVAKFAYDYGIVDKTEITIASMGVVKTLKLSTVKESEKALTGLKFSKRADGMMVDTVRVDMGEPILVPEVIPFDPALVTKPKDSDSSQKIKTILSVDSQYSYPIEVEGEKFVMTPVSMGNPHAVMFVEDVKNFPLEKIGPKFENHPCFPRRVNAEFARIIDRQNIEMRVWERGTGETLACGTGATATGIAAMLNNYTDNKVTLHLLGGELIIEWNKETNHVFMTGKARTVFEGEI